MDTTFYGLFVIITFGSPMALASALLFILATWEPDGMSTPGQRSASSYQPMVILTSRIGSTSALLASSAVVGVDVVADTHMAA